MATNRLGGYRTSMTVPLTGLDIERKAELLRRQLAGPLSAAGEVTVSLARTDRLDATPREEASALLHFTVKDPDPARVGRAFSGPLIANTLASIPGFFATTPPAAAQSYGIYAPAWVRRETLTEVVEVDGERLPAESFVSAQPREPGPPVGTVLRDLPEAGPAGPARRAALGVIAGARSGDKGGSCTLGVYTRTDAAFSWLAGFLSCDQLRELLPEARSLEVTREELPAVRAVLFRIYGLLGEGVAAATRFDPQAKAVGEWLRSRLVDVPVALLQSPASTGPGYRFQNVPG